MNTISAYRDPELTNDIIGGSTKYFSSSAKLQNRHHSRL